MYMNVILKDQQNLQVLFLTLLILLPVPTINATLTLEKVDSDSGYTEIKLGQTDIILNYDTILHIINPQEIEDITTQLEENLLNANIDTDKTIILEQQINTLKNKIKTLLPHRHRRGLFNFIGTAHKWLYGTMDNNDREEVENHLNIIDINNHNIIGSVNQQVKINR